MEIVNINYTGEGVQSQDLSQKDSQLVNSNYINSNFGDSNDYLELYIYSETGDLLDVDYDAFDYYPFLTNNAKNNTYGNLLLDPEKDLKNRGYNRGNLNIQYNFYKRLFNSSVERLYWIKEISTSRTEIKLSSQVLSDTSIREGFAAYQSYISSKNYYPVFYLNFGNNQTVIANNVAVSQDDEGTYLLIKLYEELPTEFDLKSQLWIIDKVAESVSFNVNIQVEAENVDELNKLRGPNYNVTLNIKNGQTTPYYNYSNLLTSDVSSSFQKLQSYYQDKALQINVDYSNFSNFVHFSSAVERINNFVYKLQIIESASANIVDQQAITPGSSNATYINSTITSEQNLINNTIKNFDPYEYFLYFESSSWAWPKSSTTQPYTLYSVTSSQASNFLGGVNTLPTATTQSLLWSASYYDSTNKDLLHNSIPQYLLDDTSNEPYIIFLDMIGQHFDNIWIYYKDVTNRFNATNNPDTGISLDMVGEALRGLGFKLYTNTNVSDNLYYTLFGINPDGSLLPPTGSEIITNYITSSLTTLPAQTIQDEIYKRLYHNLPYILKTKGTLTGVKALMSIYGIPESILSVREFGGNFTGSLTGLDDLNASDFKVWITTGSNGNVTGSLTLSSSLLSPYTTIQYYQGNNRVNSTNLEVGFSPADTINNNIVSSQGNFNFNQLVGSPGLQYSSSYTPLVSASNAYFSSYTQPNSIWEYIRLLKFYNNSIFKTINDYVPARANVSTGIIIKSHLYERNKYARHEPNLSLNQNFSQSIELLEVTGSDGGALSGSTAWSGFVITPLGLASISSSTGIERFNGQLSGSNIVVTDGLPMQQGDYISHITGTIETYNYGALYQNVSSSVRSQILFDLDYNSNQTKPVNYGAVTYSISQSQINNYSTYTNPNNPYAQVQDYNYFLNRSLLPRYSGSKMVSFTYNTYTAGDQSYGKTAAIDKIKYQYAYLVDIYSASAYLPNRSNAQIKYIIDNNENVLDLTKANKNIFEVQNIFKSGETTNISLFEYDETNPYTQQLANDPTLAIYEGGWRYLPILHNISRSLASSYQQFSLDIPIKIEIPAGSTVSPGSPELDPTNYTLTWEACETQIPPGNDYSNYNIYLVASCSLGNVTSDITLTISYYKPSLLGCETNPYGAAPDYYYTTTLLISNGTNAASTPTIVSFTDVATTNGDGCGPNHYPPTDVCTANISSISVGSGGGGGGNGEGSTSYVYWTTNFTSSQSCIYFLSQSNEIVFNTTMSYYYNNYSPITFSSSSDIDWANSGLPPVILPFQPSIGDKISLYNSQSLGWSELNEYTIKSIRTSGSAASITSSVLLFKMVENVNLLSFSSGSGIPTESITGAQHRSCRYIVWKRVPDETNVMLRYNPKDATLVENGLLFPQYIDQTVREGAGNVVKALKQQNLI